MDTELGTDWISPSEAARICGVVRGTIANWRKAKILKKYRQTTSPVGTETYEYDRTEVQKYSKSNRVVECVGA